MPTILLTYTSNYLERDLINKKRASFSNVVEVSTFEAFASKPNKGHHVPINKGQALPNNTKLIIDGVPLDEAPKTNKKENNQRVRFILGNLTSFSPKAKETCLQTLRSSSYDFFYRLVVYLHPLPEVYHAALDVPPYFNWHS